MSFGFELNSSFESFAPPTPPDGCTQCGVCLYSCPTFLKSEDPEQSPMGRIRLMRLLESDTSNEVPVEKLESCLSCYSCETVCPSKVEFGKMLDESLAKLDTKRTVSPVTRLMLRLAEKPSRLKPLMQAAYLAQVTGLRTLANSLGLTRYAGMQRANALLGQIKLPGRLNNRIERTEKDERVALFTGCFSSVMEQEVQQATIDVLNKLGLEVTIPERQGCCGALHHHSGELETAEKLARNNIEAFALDMADAIVTTSSGCGAGLKAYEKWLDGEQLTIPVMDISHYLAKLMRERNVEFNPLPLKVALHTPCTLRQNEEQEEAVMELLQKIPGLEIVPLSGEPRCCGAGGTQMLNQSDMADALRDDIVNEAKTTDADVLLSSNLGCAMHLRLGLEEAGVEMPLQHPVQLIAKAMKEN